MAHQWLEIVASNLGAIQPSQADERLTVLDCRVSVVNNDRTALLEGFLDKLCLPVTAMLSIAHLILADMFVGRCKTGVEERAFPRCLQTDKDDHLHSEASNNFYLLEWARWARL